MRRVDIFNLLADAADGVAVMDRHLRFVLWNSAAEQLLGFRAHEVLGRYCYEVLGGRDICSDPVCHASCFVRGRVGKPIPTRELLVSSKGGRPVRMNFSTLFVRSEKRRDISLVVHIFREARDRGQAKPVVVEASGTSAQEADLAGAKTTARKEPLTLRESEVLQLLASGATTRAIADRLCISPLTVRNHIRSILAKLGVHSRLEAVIAAVGRDRFKLS